MCVADLYTDCDCYVHAYSYSYADTQRDTNSHSYGYIHDHAQCYGNTYSYGYSDGQANAYCTAARDTEVAPDASAAAIIGRSVIRNSLSELITRERRPVMPRR